MEATAMAPGRLTSAQCRQYKDDGFLVLRGLFQRDEVAGLRAESERLLREHADLIDPANLRCRFMPHHLTKEPLFEVFDPVSDLSPLCARWTADRRLVSAVESLYGEPACLFKEKLIYKPPGARGYDLHQDIPLSWQGFPSTFLTALVAIDPSTPDNGCTEVYRGYHQRHLCADPAVYMLPDEAVDPSRRVALVLDAGDVALFHGLTPHRSGPNRSTGSRRALYISYNAHSDGGDQRAAHYQTFRASMHPRLAAQLEREPYFR